MWTLKQVKVTRPCIWPRMRFCIQSNATLNRFATLSEQESIQHVLRSFTACWLFTWFCSYSFLTSQCLFDFILVLCVLLLFVFFLSLLMSAWLSFACLSVFSFSFSTPSPSSPFLHLSFHIIHMSNMRITVGVAFVFHANVSTVNHIHSDS